MPGFRSLAGAGELLTYRIALNFRGSKFSRIAVFEHFVEIISRIRCLNCAHAANVIIWAWHTSLVLSNTHCHAVVCLSSQLSARQYLLEGISLESVPCGFDSIVPGCCPSNLLQSERENSGSCVKIFVEIISKLKTREILALYGNSKQTCTIRKVGTDRFPTLFLLSCKGTI